MIRQRPGPHSLSGTLSHSGDEDPRPGESHWQNRKSHASLPTACLEAGDVVHDAAMARAAAASATTVPPAISTFNVLPPGMPLTEVPPPHTPGSEHEAEKNGHARRHTAPLPPGDDPKGENSLVSAKYASARLPEGANAGNSDVVVVVSSEPAPPTPERVPFQRSQTSTATTSTTIIPVSSSVSLAGVVGHSLPKPPSIPPISPSPSHDDVAMSQNPSSCLAPSESSPPLTITNSSHVSATSSVRKSVSGAMNTLGAPTSAISTTTATRTTSWAHHEPPWWAKMWVPHVGSHVFLSLEGCEQQFFYLESMGPEVYRLIYDVLLPYRLFGIVTHDTAEVPRMPAPPRRRPNQPAVHAGPHVPALMMAREDKDKDADPASSSPFANIVTGDFRPSSSKDVVTVEFIVADVLLGSVFGSSKKSQQKGGPHLHVKPTTTATPTNDSPDAVVPTTSFTLSLPRVCCVVMFEQHLKEAVAGVSEGQSPPLPSARVLPRRDTMEDSNERPTGRSSSVVQSHSLWARLQRGVTQGHFESVIQLFAPMKPLKEARHLFPGRKSSRATSSTSGPSTAAVSPTAASRAGPSTPVAPAPAAAPPRRRRSQTASELMTEIVDPLAGVFTVWLQLTYLASVYSTLCVLYFAAADDPRSLKAARRGFQKIVEKARDWRHVVDRALTREDFVGLSKSARRFFSKAGYHVRATLDLCAIEAHLALGDWAAAQALVEALSTVPTPAGASTAHGLSFPVRSPLPQCFYLSTRRVQIQRLLSRTLCDPMFRGLPKTPSSLRQQRTSTQQRRTKDEQQGAASVLTLVGSVVVEPSVGLFRLLHVIDPSTYAAVPAGKVLQWLAPGGPGAPRNGAHPHVTSSPPRAWSHSPDAPFASSGSTPLNVPSPSTSASHAKFSPHTPHPVSLAKDVVHVVIPSPPPPQAQPTSSLPGAESSGSPLLGAVATVLDVLPPGKEADGARQDDGPRALALSLTLSERSRTASPTHGTDTAATSGTVPPSQRQSAADDVVDVQIIVTSSPRKSTSTTPVGVTHAATESPLANPSVTELLAPSPTANGSRKKNSSKRESVSSVAGLLPPPPPPSSTFLNRVAGLVSVVNSKGGVESRAMAGLSPVVPATRRHSRLVADADQDPSNAHSLGSRSQLLGGGGAPAGNGAGALQWPSAAKPEQVAQWLTLYVRQRAWLQSGLFTRRAAGPTAATMDLYQRRLRLAAPRSFVAGDEIVSEEVTLWMPLLASELREQRDERTDAGAGGGHAASSHSSTGTAAVTVCCSACGESVDSLAHAQGRDAQPPPTSHTGVRNHPHKVNSVFYACADCGAVYGSLTCLRSAVENFQFAVCGACWAAVAATSPSASSSAVLGHASDARLTAVRAAFHAFQAHLTRMSATQSEETILDWIALRLFGRALAMLLTFVLLPVDTTNHTLSDKVAYLQALARRLGLATRSALAPRLQVHSASTSDMDHVLPIIPTATQRISSADPMLSPSHVVAPPSSRVLSSSDELLLAEELLQRVGVPFIADSTLAVPCTVWEALRCPPPNPAAQTQGEEKEVKEEAGSPPADDSLEGVVYRLCDSLATALQCLGAPPHLDSHPDVRTLHNIQVRSLLSFLTNLRFIDEFFDLCRTAFALVPAVTVVHGSESSTSNSQSAFLSTVIVLSPLVSVVTDMPRLPSATASGRASGRRRVTSPVLEQLRHFYASAPNAAASETTNGTGSSEISRCLLPVPPGWLTHARFYLEHASWRLTAETEVEVESPAAASSFLSIVSSVKSSSMSSNHQKVSSMASRMWSSDDEDSDKGGNGGGDDDGDDDDASWPRGLYNVSAVLECAMPATATEPRTGRVVLAATRFVQTGAPLCLYGCPNLY